MAKVLLSGYYGFGNVGDEAILASTIENLRAREPGIEISVLSQNPAETTKTYGVKAFGRMSPREIISGLAAADLVVFGGGSLLQDDTSFRSLLYYLSVIFAARALGKPVVVYANGVGPLRSWAGKLLTRFALSLVRRVTVRDLESEWLLKRLHVKKPVRVTSDPAFLLSPVPADRRNQILKDSGITGASPIVWLALRPGKGPEEFYKSFVPAIALLRAKGYEPCLMVMQEQDKTLVPRLNQWLTEAGQESAPAVFGVSPREVLALLEKSDFCLGMRLHTLILSARAGVPFLGVEIDPKLGAFCRATGCPVLPDPERAAQIDWRFELERFMESKDQLRASLREKLPLFTSLASDNVDMVLETLRDLTA